jgi:hypothetical protein
MKYTVVVEDEKTGETYDLTSDCPESFIPHRGDLLEFRWYDSDRKAWIWYRARISDRASRIDLLEGDIIVTLLATDFKMIEEPT